MKRVIIAGSRGITDMAILEEVMQSWVKVYGQPDEVISGMCPGSPDMLGVEWAEANKIPTITKMPADWYGSNGDGQRDPSAGRRRNVAMAKHAGKGNHLVALMYRGGSPGTRHMINAAKSRGLEVTTFTVD